MNKQSLLLIFVLAYFTPFSLALFTSDHKLVDDVTLDTTTSIVPDGQFYANEYHQITAFSNDIFAITYIDANQQVRSGFYRHGYSIDQNTQQVSTQIADQVDACKYTVEGVERVAIVYNKYGTNKITIRIMNLDGTFHTNEVSFGDNFNKYGKCAQLGTSQNIGVPYEDFVSNTEVYIKFSMFNVSTQTFTITGKIINYVVATQTGRNPNIMTTATGAWVVWGDTIGGVYAQEYSTTGVMLNGSNDFLGWMDTSYPYDVRMIDLQNGKYAVSFVTGLGHLWFMTYYSTLNQYDEICRYRRKINSYSTYDMVISGGLAYLTYEKDNIMYGIVLGTGQDGKTCNTEVQAATQILSNTFSTTRPRMAVSTTGPDYHIGMVYATLNATPNLQKYTEFYAQAPPAGVCSHKCNGCSTVVSTCNTCSDPLRVFTNQCNCPSNASDIGLSACVVGCSVSDCTTCTIDPSKCATCNSGFYIQNGLCANCPAPNIISSNGQECKLCNQHITNCINCNNNPSTCLNCDTGYFLSNNTCLLCDTTMQLYMSVGNCLACASPCHNCSDATTCLSCQAGYLLSGTTCVTCQTSLGIDCLSCSNLTTCTSCTFSTHILNTSNNCELCPAPKLIAGNDCKLCNEYIPHCTNCSNDPSTCFSCEDGFYVENYKCLPCVSPCQYCSSSTVCLSCSNVAHFLVQEQCKTCQDLKGSNCSQCSDQNTCNSCVSNAFYVDSGNCVQCVSPCQNCSDISTCTSCVAGHFLNANDSCVTCQSTLGTNCSQCSSQNVCLQCDLPMVLKNGKCQNFSCEIGYFIDTTQDTNSQSCTKCQAQCLECSVAANICTKCPIQKGGNMTPPNCGCNSGYYLDSVTLKCQQCSVNCVECSGNFSNCTKCANPTKQSLPKCLFQKGSNYFEQSGPGADLTAISITICNAYRCETCATECSQCQIEENRSQILPECLCKKGYHDNNGQQNNCEKCMDQCLTCNNDTTCDICKENKVFNKFTRICECNFSFKENTQGVCQKCYYYNKECFFTCPQSTYPDEDLLSCQEIIYANEEYTSIFYICGAAFGIVGLLGAISLKYINLKKMSKKKFNYSKEYQMSDLDQSSVGLSRKDSGLPLGKGSYDEEEQSRKGSNDGSDKQSRSREESIGDRTSKASQSSLIVEDLD